MQIIPDPATAYRAAHYRKLMVLAAGKSASPERDEFCRLRSVETLAPGLWVTVTFLDGSIRNFRPDKIRDATPEEERQANEPLPALASALPVNPVNAPAPV